MATYQQLKGHRDLKVYQLAYKLAMEIFQGSKVFPKEEKYSLTDQIRRSSRSVAANIAEAFASVNIQKCSSINSPMQTVKRQKLKCGWILPATASIYELSDTRN